MTKKLPETSIEAYRSLDVAILNDRYKSILGSLSELGESTFEEISSKMKVEKSIVWRRLSELHKMGLIYRPGNKRVLKSGRCGFTWMLTTEATPKTEHQGNIYKPGTKTASDFSKQILSSTPQRLF